jgi:hypothetical protein
MIIIDTGPLVALFDPKDPDYKVCHQVLENITSPLYTTEAVLTEVLHMLDAGSRGAEGVKEFIVSEYLSIFSMKQTEIGRCFSLMEKYHDLPMDFADASLVVLSERFKTPKIFTLDFKNFSVYRFTKGHKNYPFELIGRELLE